MNLTKFEIFDYFNFEADFENQEATCLTKLQQLPFFQTFKIPFYDQIWDITSPPEKNFTGVYYKNILILSDAPLPVTFKRDLKDYVAYYADRVIDAEPAFFDDYEYHESGEGSYFDFVTALSESLKDKIKYSPQNPTLEITWSDREMVPGEIHYTKLNQEKRLAHYYLNHWAVSDLEVVIEIINQDRDLKSTANLNNRADLLISKIEKALSIKNFEQHFKR